MTSDAGEGAKLREMLEQLLDIPAHCRRFTVTFERGQPVIVEVEYLPHT